MFLETPASSAMSSNNSANGDHATPNGAEHDGEDAGDQGGESTMQYHTEGLMLTSL